MKAKKQGKFVLATLLVGALFLGLIIGATTLFRWLDNTAQPLEQTTTTSSKTLQPSTPSPTTATNQQSMLAEVQTRIQQANQNPSNAQETLLAGFKLHEIGATDWSDEQFYELTKLLQESPEHRQQLAFEFRINTDPKKAKRLAALLGQFDDEIITDVAMELALSGEPSSQNAGIALLAKQQPNSTKARTAITEILQVESNPKILVSALNAMAVPGAAEPSEKEAILVQFVNFTTNDDPSVRALSLSLMSNWAGETNVNEHLIQGMSDDNEQVRRTATYSLGKTQYLTDDVKQRLLMTMENSSEQKRTREAAMLALGRFKLSQDELARYSNSKTDVRNAGRSPN